jgi:ClpP class serine protease
MRAFEMASSVPWAIRPEVLRFMLDVSRREHEPDFFAVVEKLEARAREMSPSALAALPSDPLDGARGATRRGNVAILSVLGPISRYMTLFSEISGGTSAEVLAKDLRVALDDPTIDSVLLYVDSPGGQVNGTAELADMVYEARLAGEKKIVAYVAHEACSAAYWIASAAETIYANETAMTGCIGAVLTVHVNKDDGETIEIVSSQTPNKRPDVSTDEGKAELQRIADDLGEVFIDNVSRNRGIAPDEFLERFHGGAIFVGAKAIAPGLVDHVSTFERIVASLQDPESDTPAETSIEKMPHAPGAARSLTGSHAVTAASATASDPPQQTRERANDMSWLDELRKAVNGIPDDANASTDVADVSAAAATPPPAARQAATGGASADELQRLREQASALASENRRLMTERITERAQAFANKMLDQGRVFPAEVEQVVIDYVQAANDDVLLGPVELPSGDAVSRVQRCETRWSTRPANLLTTETLSPTLHRMLSSMPKEPDPRDPKPADKTEIERLIAMTALGRTQLAGDAKNGRAN